MVINRRTCVVGCAAILASNMLPEAPARAQRANAGDPKPEPRERAAMQQAAEDFLRRHRAPGIAVAIARHGRIVYDAAFGLADATTGERLSTGSRFRIASATKPITSTAIFTLVEHGRLRLTDRIFGPHGMFGERYPLPPDAPWLAEITIEHLLTHTAGGWANDNNDPMFKDPSLNHDALIAWTIKNQRLKTRPGSAYAYSNFGYCLLGRVIEKVSNLPYEDYVKRAVLQPAGVTDMRIGHAGTKPRHREVRYHPSGNGKPYGFNLQRMDSHGGWIATADDLVRFLIHVDGFSPSSILKPDTIRTMTMAAAANRGYAHGWAVNAAGNWWHVGSLPGTTSIVVRTSTKFCWAALVNAGGAGSGIDAALDKLVWAMVRKVPRWDA